MNIAIAGSTGFIGEALVQTLDRHSQNAVRLVRGAKHNTGSGIAWDPARQELEPGALNGMDAVVCLSGESIAGRWSKKKKQAILDSRIQSASLLANEIASMSQPPKVFICASAIGYYGDRGSELLDESSAKGHGFLTDVCQAWESSVQPAIDAGVRTVNIRWGVVLSPAGGIIQQIAPMFKLGLGGVIGGGKQYMSWIALEDVTRIVQFCIGEESIAGPVNGTAPNPVTNREFTKTLGRALHRPTLLPVPSMAVKLVLGEAGEELALSSTRAAPVRLESAGFQFNHSELESALEAMFPRD